MGHRAGLSPRPVIVGALAALLSAAAGCVTVGEDELVRAVRHTREPGERLGGDAVIAGAISRQLGMQGVKGRPTLWVGEGQPDEGGLGWTRLAQDGEVGLWRRATLVEAPTVSVKLEDLPGKVEEPPPLSPLRGWVQHGPASPGGELVVTVFLQPPARMKRAPCLALRVGGEELALGTLLEGRGGFVPGAGPRPVVRHRARTAVPDSWAAGTVEAELLLTSCTTEESYSPPTPVRVEVSASGLPSSDELAERVGSLDAEATWAEPRGRRYALRRKLDGSIEQVPAPPLPRVERGAAFGLLITPPLQLGPWGAPDGTVGPLTPLAPLFDEADGSMVYIDSSASMEGSSPSDRDVSRVRPEVLGHLAEVDVQSIVLGGAPRAVEGDRTAENAALLGLHVDQIDVGDNENAVGVQVVVSPSIEALPPRDTWPADVLVLASIEHADDPVEAARGIVLRDYDGGWVRAEQLGPVLVDRGIPVLAGLPDMQAVGTSVAMRFYVAPSGVQRIDLVGLEGRSGRWQRVRDERLKPSFERVAGLSHALGVRVAVGQQVAGVSVTDHGPDRSRPPARPQGLPLLERSELPAPSLPSQCQTDEGGSPAPIEVGSDLLLHRASLLDTEAGPGDPLQVELVWEALRPLPPGRMQWYVAGHPGTWRASTAPCDGLWPFQDFEPGQRVREVVRLFPPKGLIRGEGTLQLGLRLGDGRPTLKGGRFLDIGKVSVDGPEPNASPPVPPDPDEPGREENP